MCEKCFCFLTDAVRRPILPTEPLYSHVRYKNIKRNAESIATLILGISRLVEPAAIAKARQMVRLAYCTTPEERGTHLYTNLCTNNVALKNELDYVQTAFTDMNLYPFKKSEAPLHFMYECIVPLVETVHVVHAEHSGLPIADEYNGLYS